MKTLSTVSKRRLWPRLRMYEQKQKSTKKYKNKIQIKKENAKNKKYTRVTPTNLCR